MSILRRVFEKLRHINLFSSKKLIGVDLQGNRYYEEPRDSFPRRTVELSDGRNHYTEVCGAPLPVQWISWMRHTRSNPPTIDELVKADELQKLTVAKAHSIETAWKLRKLELEREKKLTQNTEVIKDTISSKPKTSLNNVDAFKDKDFEPEPWNPAANLRK